MSKVQATASKCESANKRSRAAFDSFCSGSPYSHLFCALANELKRLAKNIHGGQLHVGSICCLLPKPIHNAEQTSTQVLRPEPFVQYDA